MTAQQKICRTTLVVTTLKLQQNVMEAAEGENTNNKTGMGLYTTTKMGRFSNLTLYLFGTSLCVYIYISCLVQCTLFIT